MTGKRAKSGRIKGKKARCRAPAHVTEDRGPRQKSNSQEAPDPQAPCICNCRGSVHFKNSYLSRLKPLPAISP